MAEWLVVSGAHSSCLSWPAPCLESNSWNFSSDNTGSMDVTSEVSYDASAAEKLHLSTTMSTTSSDTSAVEEHFTKVLQDNTRAKSVKKHQVNVLNGIVIYRWR